MTRPGRRAPIFFFFFFFFFFVFKLTVWLDQEGVHRFFFVLNSLVWLPERRAPILLFWTYWYDSTSKACTESSVLNSLVWLDQEGVHRFFCFKLTGMTRPGRRALNLLLENPWFDSTRKACTDFFVINSLVWLDQEGVHRFFCYKLTGMARPGRRAPIFLFKTHWNDSTRKACTDFSVINSLVWLDQEGVHRFFCYKLTGMTRPGRRVPNPLF